MVRQELAGMRGRLNWPASVLITYCRNRIPNGTGKSESFPIISTGYKDFIADGNNLMPLSGRFAN